MKDIEKIATSIVHAAIKIHKALGPGLLESVYQKCQSYELRKSGLEVDCELPLPLTTENSRGANKIGLFSKLSNFLAKLIICRCHFFGP